ncbi:branched-chain amino acid ABC transporter permease [Acidovorax sp. HDW3]|uniref:branched-chain amino acid ABC transporter permease n=1 Tax=Acidovorax sp. HDW3 TaxID=2714923 RepID=UPI001F101EBA|nr:branched-chain amino acid ABC transporter permease [Acidovorax sp. HDW3]
MLHGHSWRAWALYALALLAAPMLWPSSLALTLLAQMAILSVICLSYNMLWGQGGMLSFGHAVYSGLGALATIHAMRWAGAGLLPLPLPLLPLVGALAGLLGALLLGWVTTQRAGTALAMISLGLGELVLALVLMWPQVFGGEGGVSADRVYGAPWWGLDFGPARQVYYLIAAYGLLCSGAMYAFTTTPLGRLLNAARDNPERLAFIGYDPRWVRYLAFVLAGGFAGVGGALAAVFFEVVTAADSVSMARSGSYLLFTFLGGAGYFFGPVLGAVLLVLCTVLLSQWTPAWQLYLGLLFLAMVLWAPGGLAGLLARAGAWWRQGWAWVALGSCALLALLGLVLLVELAYQRQQSALLGPQLVFLGLPLDVRSPDPWGAAVLLLATGVGLWALCRRAVAGAGA